MAVTITTNSDDRTVVGNKRMVMGTIAFDSSYPSNGEALTPANLGLERINFIQFEPTGGYTFEYDHTNQKVKVYGVSTNTITVTDDDNAASTGVAIYLHIADTLVQEGTKIGHIESVTAGNADTYVALNNGGPVVRVLDDDAASTAGLQIYFDEDASNDDERFMADLDLVGGGDAFVMASDGSFIRIKDDDNAATTGVAVYVDDDAANDYERVLFVSPTNADGTAQTDDTVGLKKDEVTEVANTYDLSGLTGVNFVAVGV